MFICFIRNVLFVCMWHYMYLIVMLASRCCFQNWKSTFMKTKLMKWSFMCDVFRFKFGTAQKWLVIVAAKICQSVHVQLNTSYTTLCDEDRACRKYTHTKYVHMRHVVDIMLSTGNSIYHIWVNCRAIWVWKNYPSNNIWSHLCVISM